MRLFYCLLFFLIILLQGCVSTSNLPPDIQSRWVHQPIENLEKRLPPGRQIEKTATITRYLWTDSQTRWVTIAPPPKTAGFKMVNGRNVAAIITGPPIKNLQTISCQLIAVTDNNNIIISLQAKSNGMNCNNFISRL